jgi:RNA polymerase sigma-70 factor, ECF subfamily
MEERIRRAQAGDETAFEQIVAAYAPLATRTALALLHDRAIAEDVVQDTWLNIWRALPRFDAARPFRPWLLTIVANSCRMILRRKSLPSVRLEQVGDDLLAAREDVADHMIRSETDVELTAALAALPPAQRRLIELRYFARLEVTEIALVLAVPEGTVKSRLHRTLAAMRAQLQCNEVLSNRPEVKP